MMKNVPQANVFFGLVKMCSQSRDTRKRGAAASSGFWRCVLPLGLLTDIYFYSGNA